MSLRAAGRRTVALKPLETGVDPDPLDARALARACGRPELADAPGLYRARLPVAPYAATLAGEAPPPSPDALAASIAQLAAGADALIVEGAGGLLVPLDARHTIADLARRLGLPLLIVAPDRLGVLSDVLGCHEAARARGLQVAAVILSQQVARDDDPSVRSNARILAERIDAPLLRFPCCEANDDALVRAAHASGLHATLAPALA